MTLNYLCNVCLSDVLKVRVHLWCLYVAGRVRAVGTEELCQRHLT